MKHLILILFLVGCNDVFYEAPAISTKPALEANADTREQANDVDEVVEKAIKEDDTSNLHQVKPKTDKIRANTIFVDSAIFDMKAYMENDAKEKAKMRKRIEELESKTSFKTYIPWAIFITGIIIAVLGRFMFQSVGATISGGLVAFASIGVHQYYDAIAKFGMAIFISLLLYLVGMIAVKHEIVSKAKKAIDEIKD